MSTQKPWIWNEDLYIYGLLYSSLALWKEAPNSGTKTCRPAIHELAEHPLIAPPNYPAKDEQLTGNRSQSPLYDSLFLGSTTWHLRMPGAPMVNRPIMLSCLLQAAAWNLPSWSHTISLHQKIKSTITVYFHHAFDGHHFACSSLATLLPGN